MSMSEHIMVLHRWRDHYALYEDYIDHASSQVTYITTSMGRASVPAAAAAVVEVSATDDLAAVLAAARQLCDGYGRPARLVALNEGDLDTAALVRERLGSPGQDSSAVERFRDKLAMTRLVAEAGLRTPAFADAPDTRAVEAFAEREGWPVVVKPRRGTASRGVLRLDGPSGLAALAELEPEPRLVESFCGDPIYHLDGLWTGTGLGPWRASRYVNTCVGFNNGEALGSVEVDDPDLLPRLAAFAAAVAGALSEEPWVFHLEAFVGTGPDGAVRVTFLEVGYRVGGAEIPFVWREVHGVDLMSAAVAVQLGQHAHLAALPAEAAPRPVGGWLLVPTPVPAPCRVTAADLPDGDGVGPYASVVPPVGYLVPKAGGYEHVGARFRFRGTSTADVESAIVKTASRFRLECVAEAAGAGRPGTRQEETP
jgi:hypothetical protein